MKHTLLLLLFGATAASSWATPITLTNIDASVIGTASVVDGAGNLLLPATPGGFDDSTPATALPLFGDAVVVSDNGSAASAFAVVDSGFLQIGTDLGVVDSDISAAARSLAQLSGDFVAPGGTIRLALGVDHQAGIDGPGSSAFTELVFSVFRNGATILDEFVPLVDAGSVLDTFVRDFSLAPGTLATFSVLLSSDAASAATGFAGNLSSVDFRLASVPEPSTLTALLIGLSMLAAARRWRRYRGAGVARR